MFWSETTVPTALYKDVLFLSSAGLSTLQAIVVLSLEMPAVRMYNYIYIYIYIYGFGVSSHKSSLIPRLQDQSGNEISRKGGDRLGNNALQL